MIAILVGLGVVATLAIICIGLSCGVPIDDNDKEQEQYLQKYTIKKRKRWKRCEKESRTFE